MIYTLKKTSLKCVIYIVKNTIHRKKIKKIKKNSASVDFLNRTHGHPHWIWYERQMLDGKIFLLIPNSIMNTPIFLQKYFNF